LKKYSKKLTILAVTVLALAIFAGGITGVSGARADSHPAAIAVVEGHGTVATENSELVRGFRFRLKAKVDGTGTATGEFHARVHLRNSDRVIGINARFNEGAIRGNEAKLSGKARIQRANGETIAEVPINLSVKVAAPGEYKMILELGRRVFEGVGVSGEVTITRGAAIDVD